MFLAHAFLLCCMYGTDCRSTACAEDNAAVGSTPADAKGKQKTAATTSAQGSRQPPGRGRRCGGAAGVAAGGGWTARHAPCVPAVGAVELGYAAAGSHPRETVGAVQRRDVSGYCFDCPKST